MGAHPGSYVPSWIFIVVIAVSIQVSVTQRPVCNKSYYEVEITEASGFSGNPILTFGCTDPSNGALTYSFDGGNFNGRFLVAADELNVDGSPDAEEMVTNVTPNYYASPFTLRVKVENSYTTILTVYVVVKSINDNAPMMDWSSTTTTITEGEDTAVGKVIGTCTLSDIDFPGSGHDVPYAAIQSGNDDNKFAIDYRTCALKTIGKLDSETKTQYVLEVIAYDIALGDPDSLTSTTTLTINVRDVNDNTPTCEAYNIISDISEDVAISTPLVTLNCTDVDEGDDVTFELVSGDTNRLKVDKFSGEVTLDDNLDYENNDRLLTAVVRVKDILPFIEHSTSVTVAFRISDVDDNPPVFDENTFTASVYENAEIGEVVVNLTATDADSPLTPLSRITYGFEEYCGPAGKDWFKLDSYTGSILVKNLLDWETQPEVSCKVFAYSSDKYDNRSIAIVNITLIDVNDNAPQFSEYLFSGTIEENASVGTSVLTVNATDADEFRNGEFEYSMPYASPFAIDAQTGELYLAMPDSIDYEVDTDFLVEVLATDKGTPPLSSRTFVHILVQPVNEFRPQFQPLAEQAVSELETPGTEIVTVTATDDDAGEDGEIEYYLADENVPFLLERETGVLRVGLGLDSELKDKYELLVVAADMSHTKVLSTTLTLTVNVMNENDNFPDCKPLGPIEISQLTTNVDDPFGQLDCSDADLASSLTYSEAGGDPNDIFLVDPNTGELRMRTKHIAGVYNLLIDVKDGGNPERTTQVTVEILLEEKLDFTASLPRSISVVENTNVSDVLYTVAVSGAYDAVTYQINGNGDGMFNLQPSQGTLRLVKALDRETTDKYTLTIKATTSNGQSISNNLDIIVTDYNDHVPEFAESNYKISVSENINVPTTLNTFTATDGDINANADIRYSLISGNTGNAFVYNSLSGVLSVEKSLDYETTPFYTLVLQAKDRGDPPLSSTTIVYVKVENVDDLKPQIVPSGGTVALTLYEDHTLGAPVIKIEAGNQDTGDELMFNITYGNNDHVFTMDQHTGEIYLSIPLDREQKDFYDLGILVTDTDGSKNTDTTEVKITVLDVNDNAPKFDRGNYVFGEIPHGTPSGQTVGTVTVTDEDIGTNKTFTLSIVSGNEDGKFAFDGLTLKTAGTLDANVKDTYELLVQATDKGSPARSSQAYITVNVEPEFKTPLFFHRSDTLSVEETRLLASLLYDTDAQVAGLTEPSRDLIYSIIGGDVNTRFYIEKYTGIVRLLNPLSYATRSSYTLVIQAANRYKPTLTDTFTLSLTVTQVNQHDPDFTEYVYQYSINENADIGTQVGTISATDDDVGQFGTVSYALEPNSHFAVDSATGKITLTSLLEYSEAKSYNVYATAKDNAGASSRTGSAVVIINVVDFNNHPPLFASSPYNLTVPESYPTATDFYVLRATDLDSGSFGELQYKITTGNIAIFSINPSTGALSLTSSLDFETTQQYTLTVEASDGGSPSRTGTATVSVHVLDENDCVPQFSPSRVDLDVSSDAQPMTSLYTLTASDCDAGDAGDVSFIIKSGDSAGYFTIDTLTGELKTARAFDPDGGFHTLEIIAVDHGLPMLTGTVTVGIAVRPVTVSPIGDYSFSVMENQASGTDVGTIPKDSGMVVTGYDIIGGNYGNHFSISKKADGNGGLVTSAVLNREKYAAYQLLIRIHHSTGTKDVTAAVTVLDVNDNAPLASPSTLNIQMVENLAAGNAIGTLTVTDADEVGKNSEVNYVIDPSNSVANTYFSVDATGKISIKQAFSYEVFASFVFDVILTDKGSTQQTSTATVSVSVVDVTETIIYKEIVTTAYFSHEFPDDAVAGDTVYTLSITDFNNITTGPIDGLTFTTVGSDNIFNVDPSTGVMTVHEENLIYENGRYFQWVIATVTSSGVTTSHAGLVRLDTFNKNKNLIAVTVSSDQSTVEANQDDLRATLQTKFTDPKAVRIWDIQTTASSTARRRLLAAETAALVVVVEDTAADDVSNVDMAKTFLTQDQALTALQASPDGTPVSGLSSGAVPVSKVMPYETDSQSDELSTEMIVFIVIASLAALFILIAVIAIIVYCFCFRRNKKYDQKALIEKEEKQGRRSSFKSIRESEKPTEPGPRNPTVNKPPQDSSMAGSSLAPAVVTNTRDPSPKRSKQNSVRPLDNQNKPDQPATKGSDVRQTALLGDTPPDINVYSQDSDGAPPRTATYIGSSLYSLDLQQDGTSTSGSQPTGLEGQRTPRTPLVDLEEELAFGETEG